MPTSRRRRALKDTATVCRLRERDARALLLVQRGRLVHGLPAALVALHEVLRVVLRRTDRAAAGLGVARDLPLDLALGLAAVRPPGDVITLLQLFRHARTLTR